MGKLIFDKEIILKKKLQIERKFKFRTLSSEYPSQVFFDDLFSEKILKICSLLKLLPVLLTFRASKPGEVR